MNNLGGHLRAISVAVTGCPKSAAHSQRKSLIFQRSLFIIIISIVIIMIFTCHVVGSRGHAEKETANMPTNIPFESHGACSVALIALKEHPKRVYHYSKTSGQEESWALRDYLTGEILRSGDSTMTASEIEGLVDDYAEEPAYRSVKLIPRWKVDCQAASERHFGAAHVDLVTRNPPTLGNWHRMNSQGS
jgi:hypothetical protein